jgi:hypothetical protein
MSFVTPLDLDRLSLRRRSRLAAEVLGTYLRVRWTMRDDNAERAVFRLRTSTSRPAPVFEDGLELIAAWRLARIVTQVLRRLPSDSRCLFSSLTLMCMLERRGISQKLVIAARPRPFAAHAWVEVGNQAMLPDADSGFERLMEL